MTSRRYRVFFVTDVHGSEAVFRKFLNSWKYYKADALVLGGDLTGKAMVPMVRGSNGHYRASFHGQDAVLATMADIEAFEKTVRFNGFYPVRISEDELVRLEQDPAFQADMFRQVMSQQITRWMDIADDKLANTGLRLFSMPGNDDIPDIDPLIEGSLVTNVDRQTVEILPDLYMASVGYSNPTPWHSPRECTEDEMAEFIAGAIDPTVDTSKLILNIHVPPYNSGLDNVQKLDAEFRPVFEGGSPVIVPVGSSAVRDAIQTHQPLLGLHGHIHESRGHYKIGRTLCLNPGSEYSTGFMKGVLVEFEGTRIRDFLFTQG